MLDSESNTFKSYEKKLEEYFGVSENIENISNKIYSRELILLLREIIKNCHTVPCPLTEDELQRIGIHPSKTPQKSKFKKYGGRRLENNTDNAPLSKKITFDKDKKLYHPEIKSKVVVFPNRQKPLPLSIYPEGSDEAKIENVTKSCTSLLNKITTLTYNDIFDDILKICDWKDVDVLHTVASLIFDNAINEPMFIGLYADLCWMIHKAESISEGQDFKRNFHGAIIRKCQNGFENGVDINGEFTTPKKQLMMGVLIFISNMYKFGLLNFNIVQNSIVILIRNAEFADLDGKQLMIEYVIVFMKYLGPFIKSLQDLNKLYGYVSYLDKFKGTVSNRIKFMIVELMELRDRKWTEDPSKCQINETLNTLGLNLKPYF